MTRDATSDVNFPVGWSAGTAVRITPWASAVVKAGGSRRTIPTVIGDLKLGMQTVMAGGRASVRIGRAEEFGQVLAGVVRATGSAFGTSSSSTHAGVQAGAGVDYPLTRRLAARGQLDFRLVDGRGLESRGHQYRFATSIVYTVP